jgi:rhodanese-related sulfurtransferase
VKLPNARLLTQELVQEIFNSGDKTKPVVLYDHTGSRSLDAAAYFIGHGFGETKCLDGGIDAYSTQVDASLPRYRLEIED